MVIKIIIFDKKPKDYYKNDDRINHVAENQPEVLKWLIRSGFKAPDQVSRFNAGLHVLILRN